MDRVKKLRYREEMKRVRKRQTVKQVTLEDGGGMTLTERIELPERWKQYFKGLFNVSEQRSAGNTARPGVCNGDLGAPPDRERN